nr:hypothetical protein [uncultured Oscillibacter sp.]
MIQPEELAGKSVCKIGRAAAMCWIHFGWPMEIELLGRKRILGEFALDLDCPWRIRNSSGGIELGSADMFVPTSRYVLDEDFNWDVQGNNLFDEKAKLLFPEGSQITVTAVGLSGNCDLTITFSNGLCLESFVNASSQEECWRLFMPCLEHGDLVVTGVGIEHC